MGRKGGKKNRRRGRYKKGDRKDSARVESRKGNGYRQNTK